MYRFLACVWDVEHREAALEAASIAAQLRTAERSWRTVLDTPGMVVLCIGAGGPTWRTYLLAADGGVVLGVLFQRDGEGVSRPCAARVNEQETRAIVESRGERLVREYWGRYVAFFRDASARRQFILRDPTGLFPCNTARAQSLDVYFSWLPDAVQVGVSASRIDLDYARARLTSRLAYGWRTGLTDVSQVLGGECITHERGKAKPARVWKPQLECESAHEDRVQAAAELRCVTRDVVQAWASCYPSILHALSGGLDSSIVLACLRDAPAVTCFTAYTSAAAGDERTLARLAAQRAGRDLLERHQTAAHLKLEALLNLPAFPEPIFSLGWLDHVQRDAPTAHERGAAAIFTGLGGDEIFARSGASWAVRDFVRRHGVRPSLFSEAMDAARQEQLSVWKVLRTAIWGARWSPHFELGAVAQGAESSAPLGDVGEDSLLRGIPRAAACGKRRHAYLLTPLPPGFLDPVTEPCIERVMPLRSQPLLELCLRIPTYTLIHDGWDRALARRAFYSDVPGEVVSRRTKGEVSDYALDVLATNLPFIQQLLLDGHLVKEGLADRTKLAAQLSMARSRDPGLIVQIYDCIDIEVWLRACHAADV